MTEHKPEAGSTSYKHWSIAVSCAICQAFGMALIGIYGFFVSDITETFDLNYAQANSGIPLIFFTASIAAPLLGILIDRVSIKPVMLSGVSLAMAGLYGVSQASSVFMLTATFCVLALGISMYGPVVTNALLVKAYQRNRARALAIAAMGTSFASVALPLLIAALLENFDWRTTLALLSVGIWLLTTLFIMFGITSRQDTSNPPVESATVLDATPGPEGADFLRNKNFWCIGIGFSLIFNAATLNTFCLVPHLQANDFDLALLAQISAIGGVTGFIGKMGFAIISDRVQYFLKPTLFAIIILQLVGWLLLPNVSSALFPFLAMGLLGLTAGICLPLQPFVNSLYFGEEAIGRVVGAQAPLMLPLGIASPPLAGIVFDSTGSYTLVFVAAAALVLVAGLLFLSLGKRVH